MVLYLRLNQEIWKRGDYTNDNALALTGTVYQNATMLTPYDLTGCTITVKGFNQRGEEEITQKTCEIVSAVAGTFRYKPANGDLSLEFIGDLELIVEKSGTKMTAMGRNGSATFLVTE